MLHNECRLVRLVPDSLRALTCAPRVFFFFITFVCFRMYTNLSRTPLLRTAPLLQKSHVVTGIYLKFTLGKLDAWQKSNVWYFFL